MRCGDSAELEGMEGLTKVEGGRLSTFWRVVRFSGPTIGSAGVA